MPAQAKVALIQCPAWGVDDPPLALAQLAGCLKHAGHEALVFDLNVRSWRDSPGSRDHWEWKSLPFWLARAPAEAFFEGWPGFGAAAEEVTRRGCNVAAFSVSIGSRWASLAFARALKARSPGMTTVFGGPLFREAADIGAFLREPDADILVAGPGEDVFVKLIGLYKASGSWIALPGVTVKPAEGEARKGGRPVSFTFDLDSAPAMDFSQFDPAGYRKPGQLSFTGSRGCAWACAFCASREYWGRYSFKGGDRLFAEALGCAQQFAGARHVKFYDIMANGDVASLVRFSENVARQEPEAPITWEMNAAVKPDMTPQALEKMRRAGCAEIVYGIESGSPAVLKSLSKGVDLDLAERVLRDTRASGIRARASFLAGAPAETEEDFRMTLRFLERIAPALAGIHVQPCRAEAPSRLSQGAAFSAERAEGRALDLQRAAEGLGLEAQSGSFIIR